MNAIGTSDSERGQGVYGLATATSGVTYGWQNMLDRYKKGYPTLAETGALKFTIANISKISDNAYWVMGEYNLTRQVGNANGTFMIVFKRIKGEWKIVGDHSC